MIAAVTPAALPIFRTGTHTSVDGRPFTATAAILAELAESYDPALSEAPLVVGHPALDAPAYGWTKALKSDGDVLYAEPAQVEPAFAEAVNAGRYKKVSASFYLPDSAGNPKPGKHYLRHIGFLGAAAPAVKGLQPVQFAGDDGAIEFAGPLKALGMTLADLFQRLRDYFVERDGAEQADKLIPQWAIRETMRVVDDPVDAAAAPAFAAPPQSRQTVEITMDEQTKQQLAAQSADLKAREQALADRETKARRDDAVAFAAVLVAAGKLLPRQQAPVVEILLALPADTAISFADPAASGVEITQPAAQALRGFLEELPKQIDYREKSGADRDVAPIAFAAPEGARVDASRAEIYSRAKQLQLQQPTLGWIDAVRAAGG